MQWERACRKGIEYHVPHWELLTIWSITPAITPPAIRKAAGKLSRPAPSAAFTTMKTAPKDDTPPLLLLSVSRCWSDSTLGLCRSHALSPGSLLPTPPQSSASVLIAMNQQAVPRPAKPYTPQKNILQLSGSKQRRSRSESLSDRTGYPAAAVNLLCPVFLVPLTVSCVRTMLQPFSNL